MKLCVIAGYGVGTCTWKFCVCWHLAKGIKRKIIYILFFFLTSVLDCFMTDDCIIIINPFLHCQKIYHVLCCLIKDEVLCLCAKKTWEWKSELYFYNCFCPLSQSGSRQTSQEWSFLLLTYGDWHSTSVMCTRGTHYLLLVKTRVFKTFFISTKQLKVYFFLALLWQISPSNDKVGRSERFST